MTCQLINNDLLFHLASSKQPNFSHYLDGLDQPLLQVTSPQHWYLHSEMPISALSCLPVRGGGKRTRDNGLGFDLINKDSECLVPEMV